MADKQTLASANHIVWQLFAALRRLCARVREAHDVQDTDAERQDAAICVILAVQSVEVFFNVYFRVLVSESAFAHARERVCRDLENRRFGLERKVNEWPSVVFGRKLDLDHGAGKRFCLLKDLRNELTHFKSSHETFSGSNFTIHGLADTSAYSSLTTDSADEALGTVQAFIYEVFKLRGSSPEKLPHHWHMWTGEPPSLEFFSSLDVIP